MPTYEYACKSCGEHLEIVQSFKDEALTVCPKCGGDLRKVFGSIGITFKGSGFYKTDSRPRKTEGSSSESSGSKKTGSDSSSGSGTSGSGSSSGSGTSGSGSSSGSGTSGSGSGSSGSGSGS